MKLFAIVLFVAILGCGNPLAVKRTIPPGTVGQAIQVGQLTLNVVRVSRPQSLAGQAAPSGTTFLSVLVSIKNEGDAALGVGPSLFSVEDEQKKSYQPRSPSPEPALTTKQLAKTDEVSGLMAFEVPASSSLTLVFKSPQTEFDVVRVSLNP